MRAPNPFKDLKPIQYEDIYYEDDAPLADVRKSALRLLAYFTVIILLLFALLGSKVTLARTVTYKFVLKGDEQERVYRFFDDIYLNEKYVGVGQAVSPDDPLLRITSPQIVSLINAYHTSKQKHALFGKPRLKNQAEVSDIEKNINLNEYEHKGKEPEIQREAPSRDIESAYEKITQNYGDVTIGRNDIILRATLRGTVSYLLNTEKDVPSGTVIMKIKGESNTLYASAVIPPANIGLVKEDAPIILKVSTFPHYEWGTMAGRIRHLSLTPDERGNYPFEVEITDAGKLKDRLRVGMDGELSIQVEEKSFFGYIFEKLQRGYYNLVE